MKRYRSFQLLIVAAVAGCSAATSMAGEGSDATVTVGRVPVYVGTYTRGSSKGIYLYHLDLATGELKPAGCVAEVANPSFLALHPSRPLLYAVGEVGSFEGKKGAWSTPSPSIRQTGKLSLLNQQSSQGPGPCHLMVDRSGKCVIVANYSGGSVACLPIQDDGRLGEATSFVQHEGSSVNPQRQQGPHAHGVDIDAANRFAFVADLGLDKLMIYRLDAGQGKLTANDPASFCDGRRSRPAALGLPSQRPLRLPDRRVELHDDRACVRRRTRDVFEPLQTDLDAAGGLSRHQHGRRSCGASVGQVRLRLEPRPRQHRDVRRRCRHGQAAACWATSPRRGRRPATSPSTPAASSCWWPIKTATTSSCWKSIPLRASLTLPGTRSSCLRPFASPCPVRHNGRDPDHSLSLPTPEPVPVPPREPGPRVLSPLAKAAPCRFRKCGGKPHPQGGQRAGKMLGGALDTGRTYGTI